MVNDNQLPPMYITGEEIKQAGLKCDFCGSRLAVYGITQPMYGIFDAGVYCYTCLLKRCKLSMAIPFPITDYLLNDLKLDMGLAVNAIPKKMDTGKGVIIL
tara:strand:- start:107 stop:409 length:303 start_codon:yes stop_codon:yes gene_type:complete